MRKNINKKNCSLRSRIFAHWRSRVFVRYAHVYLLTIVREEYHSTALAKYTDEVQIYVRRTNTQSIRT